MRYLITKIIKTVVVIYIILFALQYALDFALDQENACNNNTWYKIYNGKLNADIIILGNSRAEAHYNPEILSHITNLPTYNLGISGTQINVLNIRWNAYVNRNKAPKVLILDVDNLVLGTANNLFNKFQYLPYSNKKEFNEVASKIDKDYFYEKAIPLLKYRGYEMDVVNKLNSFSDASFCNKTQNGFKKIDKEWDSKAWSLYQSNAKKRKIETNTDFKLFNEGITTLKAIVKYCKDNGIKTYFVWSPSYIEAFNTNQEIKEQIDSLLKDLANKNDIKYINFNNDSIAYNKANFYDKSHLNSKGADVFSKIIANTIKLDLQ